MVQSRGAERPRGRLHREPPVSTGVRADVGATRHTLSGGRMVQGSQQCLAKAPTYRCRSDRLRGGRTSGGSHTWGLCLCPHSCAGSLRFHSYRLLVRPKVCVRVYEQNDKNH